MTEPKELSADRLEEYAHYARLRTIPAHQDSEAIRALLGHTAAITARAIAAEQTIKEVIIDNRKISAELAEAEQALESARRDVLEEAARICREEVSRARNLAALAKDMPFAELVTAGREDSATRILKNIRALHEGRANRIVTHP